METRVGESRAEPRLGSSFYLRLTYYRRTTKDFPSDRSIYVYCTVPPILFTTTRTRTVSMGRCSLVICSGSPRKTILVVAARRDCIVSAFVLFIHFFFFFFFFPLFSFYLYLQYYVYTERETGIWIKRGEKSLFDGDDETFPHNRQHHRGL